MKTENSAASSGFDRRQFIGVFSAMGLSSTLMPGVLWGMVQNPQTQDKATLPRVTKEMIDEAALIAGVEIKDEYKEMMLDDLNSNLKSYQAIYSMKLPNNVPPAFSFDPLLPGMEIAPQPPAAKSRTRSAAKPAPKNIEDLAFASVQELSGYIRSKAITSTALTEMYLERLKKYDPKFHFYVTLTEDRALAQAREADKEIAAGKYRGPLHGIPWGAKDLLAVKGYPTTWGAAGFESQRFDEDATVVKRLDAAGGVLIAKLTLGSLAMDDFWFGHDGKGERTRNPWRPEQGSSGSSAGSASAVSAGCVGFAIGSETLGSISSPATRCGVTGLRPTFGRVPRTGAMALAWTMDKLGPICRTVRDCETVLAAIYGPDHLDPAVRDVPFPVNAQVDLRKLRIGFAKKDFEQPPEFSSDTKPEVKERILKDWAITKQFDAASLEVLRNKLGIELIAVDMPKLPWDEMVIGLNAEAAAAFHDLTRSGRDKLLNGQDKGDWPNSFRTSRFIPAVEFINANRARTVGMQKMAEVFKQVDLIVTPTDSPQLTITNLTGHPAVILPNGFRPANAPVPEKPTSDGGPGTPTSITFIGNLYGEANLIALAAAYQEATEFHLKHPLAAGGK